MEIVNTIEFSFKPINESEGGILVDDKFCLDRVAAYKILFPDLDCVGWYTS